MLSWYVLFICTFTGRVWWNGWPLPFPWLWLGSTLIGNRVKARSLAWKSFLVTFAAFSILWLVSMLWLATVRWSSDAYIPQYTSAAAKTINSKIAVDKHCPNPHTFLTNIPAAGRSWHHPYCMDVKFRVKNRRALPHTSAVRSQVIWLISSQSFNDSDIAEKYRSLPPTT